MTDAVQSYLEMLAESLPILDTTAAAYPIKCCIEADLRDSPLRNGSILENALKSLKKQLKSSKLFDKSRFPQNEVHLIPHAQNWQGRSCPNTIETLRQEPRIDFYCSTIYGGPLALIKSMKKRFQLDNVVVHSDFSHGPDLMERLGDTSAGAFCMLAAGPFFMSSSKSSLSFKMISPCGKKHQYLFKKHGDNKKKRKVLVLRNSTAHLQHRLPGRGKLPKDCNLISSGELRYRATHLEAGESIVIHDPVASFARRQFRLYSDMNSESFDRWVCLFGQVENAGTLNQAVFRALVAESNFCKRNWLHTARLALTMNSKVKQSYFDAMRL